MNRYKFITASILAAGTLLVGCKKAHHEGDGHGHADGGHESTEAPLEEVGVSFSKKSGLRVPPETAKFIGLQTAEVEERKVAAESHFVAQVYRTANGAQFAALTPGVSVTTLASGRISPAEAALLDVGQSISVVAEGANALPALVSALNRGWEKSGGQIEVLLSIADKDGRLANGAFVSATVTLGGEKTVVSVPRSALLRTAEGDFVYTVSGESFVRAAVKLGGVNPEFAEVTDGLFEGDRIVTNPVMTLWMAELQSIRGGKACADGH